MDAGANVEVLTTLTALEALAPEWTALAAGSDLPMLSHAWVMACSLTLCAAQALFGSLKPPPAPSDMQLTDYARTLAAQTIAGAKADQKYTGALKLQPENLPCPTGR